ncbi:MAG: N-acetyltransferase [Methanoregula sp.]|nr:N-acetyltransferase [Methanoregula sp.]
MMGSFFIRTETPSDISEIFALQNNAFAQDGEARLVNALRNDGDFTADLSLVAVHDDRIIGHVLFPPITIESPDTMKKSVPARALAPLGVDPAFQCQGVGAALLEEGLIACRQLGHRAVIVVGHPGYYPRFGFSTARTFGISAPFPCPDEAFMALELVPGALDGVHGTVRYPHAFDAEGAHTG